MSRASAFSVARYVAWRNVRVLLKSPGVLLSLVLVPTLFFASFAGALSKVTDVSGFGTTDYNAFQYVFAMMLTAGLTGVGSGSAIVDDYETGFMGRLMLAAPNRMGIAAGYVIAIVARTTIQIAALTGVALAFGMGMAGSPLELLGLYCLAFLLNLTAALWSAGIALRARGSAATPGIILPVFVLLFVSPVFLPLDLLTGWLHFVATYNPLTRFLETGRSLVNGTPKEVELAFGIAGGMVLLCAIWAFRGVRRAEALGPP